MIERVEPLLTLEQFMPLVGQYFSLHESDEQVHRAELLEARKLGQAPFKGRDPFSLLFQGPADVVLAQRTYRLSHPVLHELDIFLVPVGRNDQGVRYEAVFS